VTFLKRTLTTIATLALFLCSLAAAAAQEFKPVAIVAVASIRENLDDIGYLTRVAGMEDQGETARFLIGAMVQGIDRERPIGIYIVPKDDEFEGISFVPLSPNGLGTILKMHRDRLGEAKDLGGGIQQVGQQGNIAFIKEVPGTAGQGGWVFAAAEKEHLANLPADPTTLLGDLPKKYNIATRLMIQNIPEKLRRTALDEIKLGIERFLDSQQARQNNLDREQARSVTATQIAHIERLVNEADELQFGFGIDEQGKRILLDFAFSAREGTSLAKAMAMQQDAKTRFAGFMLPEAAVAFGVSTKPSPEDIAQAGAALKIARTQWTKQIDDAPGIPADTRDALKSLVGPVVDVLSKTVAAGKFDGGGTVVLLPKSLSFAVGGNCVDAPGIEKIIASAADILKAHPNLPQLQLNAGTLGNLKLHRLTHPIPAGHPGHEIFGDTLNILIGVSPDTFIVAGGKNAEVLLKTVLDRSAQEKEKAVPPVQVNVAVLPILKFLKSFDEANPAVGQTIASLEQTGNDRVTVTNTPGNRSGTTRVEIQEGVLKAAGQAVKAIIARFNRP
jgi:hypothetical protein